MNPKRPTPRYIIIKMAKFIVKERILKAGRKKQSHILSQHKGIPIR